MSRHTRHTDTTKRRDCLKYGAAVVAGGALAGCSNVAEQSGTPTDGGSYSVEMAPMGTVTFEEVPEDVFGILGHHVDMALALGKGDALNAMHAPEYHQSLYEKFTDHLEGVGHDWADLPASWPPAEETVYELDSDLHLADPAKVATAEGWDEETVTEVGTTVAPWFGNTFSDTHQEPPTAYADSYQYYTLWEIFSKVAAVFREQERYRALSAVRDELVSEIRRNRPPENERPTAAMVLFSTTDDTIWGYELNQPGYYTAHTRPMGVTDALAGRGASGAAVDRELLLSADPDVLLVLGPMSSYHSIDEIRSRLADDPVTEALTAVEEGRVYTQGARRQGPLLNLFQLEMTAKQLYPEQFGAWPGYSDGESYPEIPADEQLFDRQRVADIVTGDR